MSTREEERERRRRMEIRKRRRRARRRAQVRRQRMILAISLIVILLIIVVLISSLVKSCGKKDKVDETVDKQQEQPEQQERPILELNETPQEDQNTIRLVAVGDNIIHERVGISGQREIGPWSYDHLYQYVKEDITAADLSIVVQETILVEDKADFSGYPSFGTPTEVADALVRAGFDVVAHATNHTMDKGVESVRFTIEWWKQHQSQIALLGIHESVEAAQEIKVVECKSFKIAMLNYTQLLNHSPNMAGHEYLVDVYDETSARNDIRRAKQLADIVLVVMHVGTEYRTDVDTTTDAMTKVFLEEGVDIVIGSHPHVIRRMETLTRNDGHEMLVYYSLGNFISCQNDLPCLLGGMADIKIRRDEITGKISVESAEMIPLITHYNHDTKTYAVYKMEDYTDALAFEHSAYAANPDKFSLNYYKTLFDSVM